MDRFVFWGLFLMFGLIVLGYWSWMVAVERGESRSESGGSSASDGQASAS
jgi:hypothetical protein